jgi:hypothetical protein
MPERTKKEIAAEIKALEACKGYIPHFTAFNDDNFKHLDLKIKYLNGEINTTADEFVEMGDDDQSAVNEAQSWKDGDVKDSPSSGWDNYKSKAKKTSKA